MFSRQWITQRRCAHPVADEELIYGKDLSAEQAVEAVLDEHGIFYTKSETWIESVKLYEVLFIFDMEA